MFKNKKAIFLLLLLALAMGALAADRLVTIMGGQYIAGPQEVLAAQAALVPGAFVFSDGQLCEMLADRVETAVDLYKSNNPSLA